jgi:2-haloacid dehalogenase
MLKTRRELIALAAAAPAAVASLSAAVALAPKTIKAVVFDGLAVIDTRPIGTKLEALFPGRGAGLGAAWRTRQFEYAWLRTLGGRYVNFWQVSEQALDYAASSLKLELSRAQRDEVMAGFLDLEAWPDAPVALGRLVESGMKLAFLSNFTAEVLEAAARNSGIEDLLDEPLTTDLVKAFKPDPRAYRMAVDAFMLERDEIAFVAYAGWDVAGAKWFGYPTYWANRMSARAESLGVEPDGAGPDLTGLPAFLSL